MCFGDYNVVFSCSVLQWCACTELRMHNAMHARSCACIAACRAAHACAELCMHAPGCIMEVCACVEVRAQQQWRGPSRCAECGVFVVQNGEIFGVVLEFRKGNVTLCNEYNAAQSANVMPFSQYHNRSHTPLYCPNTRTHAFVGHRPTVRAPRRSTRTSHTKVRVPRASRLPLRRVRSRYAMSSLKPNMRSSAVNTAYNHSGLSSHACAHTHTHTHAYHKHTQTHSKRQTRDNAHKTCAHTHTRTHERNYRRLHTHTQ